MKTARDITELIGRTPLVELNNLKRELGFEGRILAKIEAFNPGGSVKDRVAIAMVEAMDLQPNSDGSDDSSGSGSSDGSGSSGSSGSSGGSPRVIIEPTSGNTGVGLAMVAAARGLRLILTMPESMSVERRQLLAAYGAELVLTPAAAGMQGAVDRAHELQREIEGSVILGQFDNPANPEVHRRTTAVEIWDDTGGDFNTFVAGVGTGGTVSGAGAALKERNPSLRVVAVEPSASPLLSGGVAAPHKIQGIGANFVPANFKCEVVDQIVGVGNDEAIEMARLLALREGILVGISSGAAVVAAVAEAVRGRCVVVVLPDGGERYLSTGLFGVRG